MKKKNKWIKRVIIGVIVLALLGGLAYLGWRLYGQEDNPEDTTATVIHSKPDKLIEANIEAFKSPKDSDPWYMGTGGVNGEYYELDNAERDADGNVTRPASLRMRLYIATTQFSLDELDEAGNTVRTWYSNPPTGLADAATLTDPVAVGMTKLNDMRSTLILYYSAASADKPLNSYEYSVEKLAYQFKFDEERRDTVDVEYTIGFLATQSQIPMVLTDERFEELHELFSSSADKNTASKWRTFNSNYASWTIQQLLIGRYEDKKEPLKRTQETTPENRQLGMW